MTVFERIVEFIRALRHASALMKAIRDADATVAPFDINEVRELTPEEKAQIEQYVAENP